MSTETPTEKPRWRWQVGIRTAVLVVALIAVWLGVFINRRENARLESRIKVMLPLSREMIIDDPSQIAVVKEEELWFDENHWDIALPAGRYRLCLATREVAENGYPSDVRTAPLSAGRHRLTLEQKLAGECWRVSITCDGHEVLAAEEPKDWDPGHGSSGGGQFTESTQLDPGKPVELFRRRFMQEESKGQSSTPQGPTEGVLLWIETDRAMSP